jgi:hypothetical protein
VEIFPHYNSLFNHNLVDEAPKQGLKHDQCGIITRRLWLFC